MKKDYIPFENTHLFSRLVTDYIYQKEDLQPYFQYPYKMEAFLDVMKTRTGFECNRDVLVASLKKQYDRLKVSEHKETALKQIESLGQSSVFTVTTGHQLNVFTGPLYSIYKIATAIRLANELNVKYPKSRVVPVFWMATEDHDLEEINNISIFGKQVKWETQQTGAAGRMSTDGISDLIPEIRTILNHDSELLELFKEAYSGNSNLADATRHIMHRLFGEHGLIIIDGDDPNLKSLFIPEMKRDLFEHAPNQEILKTIATFETNYKVQVQPREINLFYLQPGIRERIVQQPDGTLKVNNTSITFSTEELVSDLNNNPENFSPNVVLRPLYQEKILPNIAYVGGPGELNYWMEYLQMFVTMNVSFPMLVLRNCMLLVDGSSLKKIKKLKLELADLFKTSDQLAVQLTSSENIDLSNAQSKLNGVFGNLKNQVEVIDSTLVPSIEAELQKTLKSLQVIQEKVTRALKKKNETTINQVNTLLERLFPNGGLQERSENLLSFGSAKGYLWINEILEMTEPLATKFIILSDENS